jgi:hypothetical protein
MIMTIIFAILTIYNQPYIKLTEEFYAQVKRKLEWLREASGVPNFTLPMSTHCEIPMFIRSHYCRVDSKFQKKILEKKFQKK